jgi:membrane protease YdiL (CAAX protease family)
LVTQPVDLPAAIPAPAFPPKWYPDPWSVAPWRWWDGDQWTPVIYGPYGEAWPSHYQPAPVFVAKGPGVKGGGIAAIGAGVGSVASIAVVIVFVILPAGNLNINDPWYLLWSQLALWIGFIGAVVVASRRNGTGSLVRDFGLSWPTVKDAGLGLAGGVVGRIIPLILLVAIVLAGPGFGVSNSASPTILGLTPAGPAGWIIVFSLSVFGAPFIEELFFRGLLQGAFTQRVGAIPAIFITAVIFCFAHVLSEGLAAPLELFPAAVVLGYLRYRTGRLAAGMVAHATFNASLFLLFLVPAFR